MPALPIVCRHTKCVMVYRDCPYGDDEAMCPVLACSNMLRCGQTCVHPSQICDGTMQCEFGEDELACGAPKLPSNMSVQWLCYEMP